MADQKISDLAVLAQQADILDLLEVIDVSDLSMAATGTNKKMSVVDFLRSKADQINIQPSTASPAAKVVPKTVGRFLDFYYGVNGVRLTLMDPPSPGFISDLVVTGTGTFTYSTAHAGAVAPLPCMVRYTNNGGANRSSQANFTDYPTGLTTHYTREYVYFESVTPPTYNLWELTTNGLVAASKVRLQWNNASHKFQIVDGSGNVKAVSALGTYTFDTLYRIETKVTHGAAGTVTVRIYAGHSTTFIEEFVQTATWDNGTIPVSISFGNAGGTAFTGQVTETGGWAYACTDWPGAYNGRANALEIDNVNGTAYELDNSGRETEYAEEPLGITSGGQILFQYQKGDPIVRSNERGMGIGVARGLGSFTNDMSSRNMERIIRLDPLTGRIWSSGMNTWRLHDPPDNEQIRSEYPGYYDPNDKLNPVNTGYSDVGTGAVVTAGNPEITFSTPRARAILIAVTATNVANNDTVTINDRTYTFKTALTPTAGQVLIGASKDASLDNLIAAVNGAAGSGTLYAAGTLQPTGVTASYRAGSGGSASVVFTATTAGTAANSFPKSKVSTTLAFIGSTAFFTGGDRLPLELTFNDIGKGLMIGGALTEVGGGNGQIGYNIVRLTGPNSCIVSPTPDGTASPSYVWKLYGFPTPRMLTGLLAGGTVAQYRVTPFGFPFCRSAATGLTTTAASASVTAANGVFTAADIGRFLVISTAGNLTSLDPTLASDNIPFTINDVQVDVPGAGTTTIILNKSVLSTLSNVGWSLAYGIADASREFEIAGAAGVRAVDTIMNCSVDIKTTLAHLASNKIVGGGTWMWKGMNPRIVHTAGSSVLRDVFHVDTEGPITAWVGPFRSAQVALVYSASITIDSMIGSLFTLTVTNTTAFTMNAPVKAPVPGLTQRIVLIILNSAGAAMGVITWNSVFTFPTAWVNPASTKRKKVAFDYDPTTSKWIADVPSADY